MAISNHISTFAGLPVVDYPAPESGPESDPAAVAWRLDDPDYEGGDVFKQQLTALAAEEWAGRVTALVIGNWGSSYEAGPPMAELIAVAGRLTALRAIFLGEMTYEECEISWINHDDVTPLLVAYPALEVLRGL